MLMNNETPKNLCSYNDDNGYAYDQTTVKCVRPPDDFLSET